MNARPCTDQRGIALVAVLIALALLLALVVPFAASMGFGSETAHGSADERVASLSAQSVRTLLVNQAAMGHPAVDATPGYDTVDEYGDQVDLPPAFGDLKGNGRVRLGGEVHDLQRRIHLDAATPLLLGNLIGTSCRLTADLLQDTEQVTLDDASNLPDEGLVWVDHEVIKYLGRTGNALTGLARSQLLDRGFIRANDHEVKEGALVLDWRCVVAATWSFDGRTGGTRTERKPLQTLSALNEMQEAGLAGFTLPEFDVFERTLSPHGGSEQASVWGRAERVFDSVVTGSRTLRVKTAVQLGPGSLVRLRDVRDPAGRSAEYNLVMVATRPRGPGEVLLPSELLLHLLLPVARDWPGIDTLVEPLVPPPVNINTASSEVIAALCLHNRRAQDVREHVSGGQQSTPEPAINLSEARAFADAVVEQRSQAQSDATGPFRTFEDLARRVFQPRLDEATSRSAKVRWLLLYRNLHNGRDGAIEMGTAPVCFRSGPWVAYRAAASVSRSALATAVSSRNELQGVAAAVPGFPLRTNWASQEQFEDAFRLEQRAAYHHTLPINTSAVNPSEPGIDPAPRYFPHVVAMAWPDLGLGQPRFPTTDTADAGFQLAPSTTPANRIGAEIRAHEAFSTSLHPRGRDTTREGVYLVRNTGPSDRGAPAQPSNDHSRISFPFTMDGGVANRFGIGFWVEPEALGEQTFFEYGTGDRDHNRIALAIKEANLVLAMHDEAGLDPEPTRLTQSGPERTELEWRVPVTELGAPAGVPLHVNIAAYAGRPNDVSLFVDGVPRGKPKYSTFLTSSLPVYDPTQNTVTPGAQTRPTDVDVIVESTDGFPPQGVLRIGLELFEYTAMSPGVFHCRWRNSMGGRMARMRGEEWRPNIPTDAQGRPTVDINSLRQQGVNLDVAPEHPVGSLVELYGYSDLPWPDSNFAVGDTRLASPVGAWAVARAFIQNPVPIAITAGRLTLTVGLGLDVGTTTDIELADPTVATPPAIPPAAAQQAIADAFPATGGMALLIQQTLQFDPPLGMVGASVNVGGVEVIRYSGRQGTRLTGIQRGYQLPGDNAPINPEHFDGQARRFVTNWTLPVIPNWNTLLGMCLFVVPISLEVGNASTLHDPGVTNVSEWVQLYQEGNEEDTEWVRYDQIAERNHLVRGNRGAWNQLRFLLTDQDRLQAIQIGQNGSPGSQPRSGRAMGTVTATSGYIGYIPQLEATFPIIYYARQALGHRGDMLPRTSSHAQQNSIVLPCQRVDLRWGNYGAYTGRLGRNDRITLIAGSTAGGSSRPATEWHTVNWQWRRYDVDNTAQGQVPAERLGNFPFQLVAFKYRAAVLIQGPSGGRAIGVDPRLLDRVVKFPSGELASAYVADIPVGGAQGGRAMQGILDEVAVTTQLLDDLVLDEIFDASAMTFTVRPDLTLLANGPFVRGGDLSAAFPQGGGLVDIDGELIGFQSRENGVFQVAARGRGLLGTTARGHDRGARVRFLMHVPAAILSGAVQQRSDVLPVQALGSLPLRGTVYMGQELIHYAWVRRSGDQVSLEMPRFQPPSQDPAESGTSQGLFRGRYGTLPRGAGQGEVLVGWPFRVWDRYTEGADDPEMATFQLTSVQSPVHWQSVRWTQETTDVHVQVLALGRVDNHGSFAEAPDRLPAGMFRLQLQAGDERPLKLDFMGSQLETRFFTVYLTGCFAANTWTAHGWKTAPKVKDVVVEYEGQGQTLRERVTVR